MIHLSEDEFARLVDKALADVPEQFKGYMANLAVEIRPQPTRRLLGRLKLRGAGSLLGLYHGASLMDRNVDAPIGWPETIYIFQKNIEAICDSPREIVREVRKTVLHEIGHHFGMSEEDLDELGYG